MTKRLAPDPALESALESAQALFRIGAMTQAELLEIQALCGTPLDAYTPRQIEALRKREKLSQERFAYALGVQVQAVRGWESGAQRPSRQSLKLLNLVDRKGVAAIL